MPDFFGNEAPPLTDVEKAALHLSTKNIWHLTELPDWIADVRMLRKLGLKNYVLFRYWHLREMDESFAWRTLRYLEQTGVDLEKYLAGEGGFRERAPFIRLSQEGKDLADDLNGRGQDVSQYSPERPEPVDQTDPAMHGSSNPADRPFFVVYLDNPNNIHFFPNEDYPSNLAQLGPVPIWIFQTDAAAKQVVAALAMTWAKARFKIESTQGYGGPKRAKVLGMLKEVSAGRLGESFKEMSMEASRLSSFAEEAPASPLSSPESQNAERSKTNAGPQADPARPDPIASKDGAREGIPRLAVSAIGHKAEREEFRSVIKRDGDGSESGAVQKSTVPRYEWLAKAMLLVKEHPDYSDRKIAKLVDINPSQLTRSNEYQTAASFARRQKTDFPRGSKNGNSGEIEAEAETREID